MTTRQRKLYVDDEPNLTFMGELLAEDGGAYQARNSGRFSELSIYKTTRGRYVCYRVRRTNWQNEDDGYEAKTVDTHAEVIAFFGHGDQAKRLYKLADIANVVDPDDDAPQQQQQQQIPHTTNPAPSVAGDLRLAAAWLRGEIQHVPSRALHLGAARLEVIAAEEGDEH
jgi:hypothetical protein